MAQGLPDLEPLDPSGGRRVEQAVAAVRAAIGDGRMKPGVRYSVYQLAASLGVSAAATVLQLTRPSPAGSLELWGFSLAFCLVSLLSAISQVWYWRLPASAGYQLIRR